MNLQKTPNSQSGLENENQSRSIILPDFRLYQKAKVIKPVWYWHENRHISHRNRKKNPEINPHIHGLINLQQRSQEYTMEKGRSLQ